jgi:hypothetical protein
MLAMLLEGDPAESGGRVDLSTGECRPAFTDEPGPVLCPNPRVRQLS